MSDRTPRMILNGLDANLATYAGVAVTINGVTYWGELSYATDTGRVRLHDQRLSAPRILFDPNAPSPGGSVTPCTFSDLSGANLSPFVTNFGAWYEINGIVTVFGSITYPPNTNPSVAAAGLPVAVPNKASVGGIGFNGGNIFGFTAIKGTSRLQFYSLGSTTALTNAQMSGYTVDFGGLSYPVN